MARVGHGIMVVAPIVVAWWAAVVVFQPPEFILPQPQQVGVTIIQNATFLAYHAGITLLEIILGLIAGTILGVATALAMNSVGLLRRTIQPLVSASQALPVFAIAPLLVLWFGLGLGSKIAMATLIIYFPVASAFSDGLQRTNKGFVDLAQLYNASPTQLLIHFKLPAAMPALASGLRVAATIAPIGAIVGEWVGAAKGLGFVINQANAHVQTDIVFAGIVLLMIMVLILRAVVDAMLNKLVYWRE